MLRTFDPEKVNVTFNTRQLRMFGDSLFTLARDEANVTITLQQESPDISYLEQCAERYVKGNIAITDANDSGILFYAQDCMVEKLPDRQRGKDAPDVSIVFLIPDIHII